MDSPRSPGVPIATSGLGFAYDGRQALSDVDVRADPGEIVGLIGPNGAGKSTLIRIVSGIAGAYRGSARIDGREVRDVPASELARMVAVVPQEPTFGFPFTALEIVLMGRHPHLAGSTFESPADVEIAHAALERCGASALASRRIHELSSGERQRIIFAKALAQQPRALLLDEPASFLDVRHQVELYDIVRDLAHEGGATVLTALHDLNLAAEYCDRIYLLLDGVVAGGGRTEEVFTYANLTRVFGTEVYVDTNSLTGKLLVIPLSGRVQRALEREGGREGEGDP